MDSTGSATGSPTEDDEPPAIAVVGAGPRGVGLLERIAANVPELYGGRLVVHLVDPFPPGPGRARGGARVAVRATRVHRRPRPFQRAPGEPVLSRGFGPAFVDLVVMLTDPLVRALHERGELVEETLGHGEHVTGRITTTESGSLVCGPAASPALRARPAHRLPLV